jgi:hypothetical protein
MKRWIAATATACCAVVGTPAAAHADPTVPQPNTPCAAELAGAYTRLPDLTTLLKCDAGQWRVYDDPYPHSDRWFTYGPTLTLHGEGKRNRELDSGDWTAQPLDAASRCTARHTAIAATGGQGPLEESTGEPGWPLRLRLPPLLFTVELSGYCLWHRG